MIAHFLSTLAFLSVLAVAVGAITITLKGN
jgi:hypothetical protein